MIPVAIVLVDYNGLDDTRKCLHSLRNLTEGCRIIVVDNASRIDVAKSLAGDFPTVEFIRSSHNGGWAGGNNIGMRRAFETGAELVVLLNNDTTVSPEIVARLRAAALAHPEFGIVGPVIRFMEPPHDVQTEGVTFNRPDRPGFFQSRSVPLDAVEPPKVIEVDIVNGCCLTVRRRVYERIGLIDEQFFLIHEESDFCLRAQRAGFRNGVLAEAHVWHKGSSTFQREGKRLQRYFDARNLFRLLARHPGRTGARTVPASYVHALRYCYYRYAIERENGFPESAQAVVEGIYDALVRRFGPHSKRKRPGLFVLERSFDRLWKWSQR